MDAKDLRSESGVSERNNDGSKYSQSGGLALHCDRNKSYQDIGSNSLGKVDLPNARPCAVIGPDRVVPPPAVSEAYHIKKTPTEPWQCMDSAYRRPPEYPHKLSNFQNPTRNISPRQTFQENMQRIMVPPTYNSIKINDDTNNYTQISDRNNGLSKNIKLNVLPEAKFCDVPYVVNPNNNNDQKSVRNPEMCLPSVNPTVTRTAPHGWPPGSVNLRSSRMYGAPEIYQYQDYSSCAGPRPVVPRPHRTVPEEQGYVYADPYYQEGNIRFKPYPSVKERYPQQRYDYIGNYPNPFPPPPGFPAHKTMPSHPYPPYPPIKYLDSRVTEPVMEGYPRNTQNNYNIQYRNHVIHPNYGPVIGNCPPQNKMHPYPPDAHIKTIAPNKLPYDNNAKAYIEYENNRAKMYPPSENYFVNEMSRMPVKSQVIMPNYTAINMHNVPPNPYYKKDGRNYEQMAHYRNMDPNLNIHNVMSRHPPVFSPNTIAISPTDSTASNDTSQTLGTSQEDCGYVSQSSTASVRSVDSGINRIPNDYLRKYYDSRYGPIVRTSPMMSKSHLSSNNNTSKEKKNIDVRQFLQMWNEGDEEGEESGSKEIIIQTGSSDKNSFGKAHEAMNSQEQLYVLGLVNVPSEELAKYEHIQKVSKLPENIKGYNSIELLHQFEEVIESSNMTNYKSPNPKEFQMPIKGVPKQVTGVVPPRPVSPLDVEAKISQSVIHKEVGCNFEIKPCSPKMLNVEVAAPVQNILAERAIEKVANPVMIKSPMLNGMEENIDCNVMKRPDHRANMNDNLRIPSCKMVNTQFSNNNTIDSIKNSYSLHDLESNSGLCLASLPRLDNDMELNFPEVNQQFINANKGDSSVLTSTLRDLPTLEVSDQTHHQIKEKFEKNCSPTQEKDVIKSPYMVDSEKEVSRLSKYRKSKTPPASKENLVQQNINAIRTDSVIIKNPENIKNYEEHSEFSSNNLNKAITEIQQAPINLTAQGSSLNAIESESHSFNLPNLDNTKPMSVDIAIDFSLNKTDFSDNAKCIEVETKVKSELKTRTGAEENSSNTSIIKSSDPSDPIENLMNSEPKCENTNPSLENNEKCDTFQAIIGIDDKKPDPNDSATESGINKKSNCESNTLESDDQVNKEITNVSSEKISTTEFVVNSNELANDNNYSLMEINNQNAPTENELQESKYHFLENDLAVDQNPMQEFEETYGDKNENNKNTNVSKTEDTCEIKDETNSLGSINVQNIETECTVRPEEVRDKMSNKEEVNTPHSQSLAFNDFVDEEMYDSDYDETKSSHSPNIQSSEVLPCSDVLENTEVHSTVENEKEIDEIKDLKENISEDSQQATTNVQTVSEEKINEYKLKDIEEKHDAQQANPKQIEDIKEEKLMESYEKSANKCLWYGSKELYSPWIQKLWFLAEGIINSRVIKSSDSISDIDFLDTENKSPEINFDDATDCHLKPSQNQSNEEERELDSETFNCKNDGNTDETCEPVDVLIDSINNLNYNNHKTDDDDDHDTEPNESLIKDKLDLTNNKNEETDSESVVDKNFGPENLEDVTEDVNNDLTTSESDLNTDKTENITMDFESSQGSPVCTELNGNDENVSKETDLPINPEDVLCEAPDGPVAFDVQKGTEINCDDKSTQNLSSLLEEVRNTCSKFQPYEARNKKSLALKRSLSDSALNLYNDQERLKQDHEENVEIIWPFKRRKVNNVENELLAQNLCNIIHNNRRNSISSIYNEENVSFCILIDNSCIITEEENGDPEKICYTELTEGCLAEIHNNELKDDEHTESLTEEISNALSEDACDYSDTLVLECEDDKNLDESWVEDVACVETVISDDIAEDIEISGPSSPKENDSDNDESGVFSSNEHTDKVKYIYGDKMCTDDAQIVDTLYKTPQMDVNRALFSRETQVSHEYDSYYDNDTLEKMLSESNDQPVSPYVPEYINSMLDSGTVNSDETPENKENLSIESVSSFQNKARPLDKLVDMNVENMELENKRSIDYFDKTQDGTVHSCESSVDNVFTYKQKEEDVIYTTSSSPEVSSTTSEEKNSGILLKITNYQGSRISQINDISGVNKRSSCKFTEDKEYLQSHNSFPTNRPLLTKGAQKYIPPLKESIRDLKVKLSLPQHSLLKLKQLKISKDEPKLTKHSSSTSRVSKKPKPKFEDVLKSIDEIQFKMHKEKSKKSKKSIPKVVIKKNQNGSHYASTSNKDDFNPDLTGRKWQPWVFIEKNTFIDKMAIRKKTKAIYSHRKRTYVLAEKFQKYKSASSAKFVISPPVSDTSSGLKYTIRLKHNY